MRQGFVVSEVIDCRDLDIFFFQRDFQRWPAYSAKTVDNFSTKFKNK